jgi:predicted ATPase/transcriptional regulator with XRE-family HTH domain
MSGTTPPPFGEMLRSFRVRAGLSQEALSDVSAVSVRTISDLERGQRTSAHLETIRLLAQALRLSSDQYQQFVESAHPANGGSAAVDARPGPGRWSASVPAPTTPFVGRVQELDELLSILECRSGEIVTLTGPGGVGKTRLAIEAAHRLAPSFDDGAVFVDLAMVTEPERVPDAIAQVLGLTLQSASTGELLASFLSTREVLLVLDNFEQLIDAATFVARLQAACPNLTILITSRVRLRLSNECERAVSPLFLANVTDPLDRLQTNEANRLFAERARRVDPRFTLSDQNAVAVTEICRRLDGLPLAIELAASRLRILPVPALLDRLDQRLPLLTGGDRDLHPRQQSMRETIAWSYDLLPPVEQRFLRWMSVFVGGLSLESVEALGFEIGLSPIESLETVTTLVESGLAMRVRAMPEHARFQMFETIREFGLERLAQMNELDAARRFHASHFLEFVSRDAPRPDELVRETWIGQISPEHPNLIPAFDYLCVPETADQGVQFAAALGAYWDYCGPLSEAQPRLNRVLAISSPEPTLLKMNVLCWTSSIIGLSRDYQAGLAAATQCVELANRIGTPSDRAAAIQAMAWVQEYHEHFDSARDLLEQAMELWESVGNTVLHAVCLMLHAGLEYARGELERAKQDAARAKLVFQDLGEVGWTSGVTWYQGMFAMADGRPDLAAAFYEQSLRMWLQSDSSEGWFKPLVGLADAGAAAGCYREATRLIGAADEMLSLSGAELMPFDKPGYDRAESLCRYALGDAEFATLHLAGTQLTPEAWLSEASTIVDAARALPTVSAR